MLMCVFLLVLKGCVFFSQAKSPLFLLRSIFYRKSTTKKAGGLAFCYFVAAAFLQVNVGQLFKLCVLYRKKQGILVKKFDFYTVLHSLHSWPIHRQHKPSVACVCSEKAHIYRVFKSFRLCDIINLHSLHSLHSGFYKIKKIPLFSIFIKNHHLQLRKYTF